MEKTRYFVRVLVVSLIAAFATSIGIALYVNVGLGSDTLTVLLEGVHRATGISLGLSSIAVNAGLLLLAFILNRKDVGAVTVVFTLSIGTCLDIVNKVVAPMMLSTKALMIRLLILIFAQLCISFGFAFLIKANLGKQSADIITYFLVDKFKKPYLAIRTGMDALFLLLGWLLGGVVGIGTVFSTLSNGFLIKTIGRMLPERLFAKKTKAKEY